MRKEKLKTEPWWRKFLVPIFIAVIGIPTGAMGWSHLQAVWAAPREIEQVKEDQGILTQQTTQIGKWVEQAEKETDLKKKAPLGFRWDEVTSEYIVYKDDPRLRRK